MSIFHSPTISSSMLPPPIPGSLEMLESKTSLVADHLACVASCSLNQWAMDFDLNLRNIMKSIHVAKEKGARFRTGPELEVCGYGCEDHFLEDDTLMHSWESIAAILKSGVTDDMLIDVGMPVAHRGARYNCRVFMINGKLLLIRPKTILANDGNYRESRWFQPWKHKYELHKHRLPFSIQKLTGQRTVPFGVGIVECLDGSVAAETCEELWAAESPHVYLSLNGADIIVNGSGSHHNLRKRKHRVELIVNATSKCGGVYLFSNQQGCDGGRLYFDGSACIAQNGRLLKMGTQFSVHDVEVVTAVVDLGAVRTYRHAIISRSVQSSEAKTVPRVEVDFVLGRGGQPFEILTQLGSGDGEERSLRNRGSSSKSTNGNQERKRMRSRSDSSGVAWSRWKATLPIKPQHVSVEEEIAKGPACWLWDYLRRSGASGFFLPLSGGMDSAATACSVSSMCDLVLGGIRAGDKQVLADCQRVCGEKETWMPETPQDIANRLFMTCYMATENSTKATRDRAAALAKDIGCYHLNMDIDMVVSAVVKAFTLLTGKKPSFTGSHTENLALQNVQARLRMVMSYLLAQLLPWVRGRSGFLLVLGSSTVDEALRGYYTKYDCSSADLNPIGGVSKLDLRRFLRYMAKRYKFTSLDSILEAKATAELRPADGKEQTDEDEMGMTFEELGWFGRLRQYARAGPVLMYQQLKHAWTHLTPSAVGSKVKSFFTNYARNRHKMAVLTPSYHAEKYSPDDNRYDHRPFLYNCSWPRQFGTIDALVHDDMKHFQSAKGNSEGENKKQK